MLKYIASYYAYNFFPPYMYIGNHTEAYNTYLLI